MKKLPSSARVILGLILLAALMVLGAPAISRLMGNVAAARAAGTGTAENTGETGLSIPFLAALHDANAYGMNGIKSVSGPAGSYGITFASAVKGDDYVVETERNKHTLRQLFVDGQYSLADDTSKTLRKGVLEIAFPDDNIRNAITGRIIRTTGEIVDGMQLTRVDIYYEGTVYAFYLNQQGELVRYYYIYDGNEVTLSLTAVRIGGSCCASFDIPASYTVQ